MISVTLSQLTDILNGELQGADITLDAVTTDTRKLTPGCLFVALKGERFDAHDFADQAKAGGAGALLVSRPLDIDLPQLIVKDTRLAFGELAAWVRQQVPARVVALTGSSGKTSVKEMTAAILSQCGNTLYTAGNLNNDIGVPMTLLRLTPEYDYAVIELGANHQGEIAWTVSLTRPEAALVNNLAAAHLEGFGSLAGVYENVEDTRIKKGVREKLLFVAGGTQVESDRAKEAGADAGFGRGTHGNHVATFLVKECERRENN